MSSTLSESLIVSNLAEQVCQRMTHKVILSLQTMKGGLLSGDNSGLTNAWEEICVQVQYKESYSWDVYDLTVRQLVSGEVTKLLSHEREAIWLQTPAGEDWDAEDEGAREGYPVNEEDIVEYLKDKYVYQTAGDWSNKRIRKFLYAS
jgi:hypothetical protein